MPVIVPGSQLGKPGQAAPDAAVQIAGADPGSVFRVVSTDTTGRVNVIVGNTLAINGSVSVVNTPAVTLSGTADVSDRSARLLGHVTVDNLAATQPVSGSVAVSNFPSTQTVAGAVSVSNFPATQPVSIAAAVPVTGTFWQATQPVSGTVAVSNFPGTQPVSLASIPLAATAPTLAGQTTELASLAAIQASVAGSLAVGGVARTANPAAVADGQKTSLLTDKVGRMVVAQGHARELVAQSYTTIATTTETVIVAAGAAGVFNDLTFLSVSNTSLLGTTIDFRDAAGGAIRLTVFVAAGTTLIYPIQIPVTQATAASAWTAQLGTAVTAVKIFAQSIKNT